MMRRKLFPPARFVMFVFAAVTAAVIAAIVWPTFTATAQAQDSSQTATVLVAKLNVRSGPGTTYARVGAVNAKDVLTVLGQAQNCGWLKIQSKQLSGWVSGQPAYVKLSVPCSKIPAAAADAAVAATTVTTTTAAPAPQGTPAAKASVAPTAIPTAGPTAGATATPTAIPTAAPVPTGEAQEEDPLPKDMACFLMRNEVGPELNVTLTNKDNGKAENFRVPPSGQTVWCLYPGRYAATIDAPPPWNSINADINVQAGERFVWPIKGDK